MAGAGTAAGAAVWACRRRIEQSLILRVSHSCRSPSWTTSLPRTLAAPGLRRPPGRRGPPAASTQMPRTPGQPSESSSRGSSRSRSSRSWNKGGSWRPQGGSSCRSSRVRPQALSTSSRLSSASNRAARGPAAPRRARAAPRGARAAASRHHWQSCYNARLPLLLLLLAARFRRLLLQLKPPRGGKSCCSSGRAPRCHRQDPADAVHQLAAAQPVSLQPLCCCKHCAECLVASACLACRWMPRCWRRCLGLFRRS